VQLGDVELPLAVMRGAGITHLGTRQHYSRLRDLLGWPACRGDQQLSTPGPFAASPFPVTAETMRDWHFHILCRLDELSDTTERHPLLPHTWRACKTAYRILSQNRERLDRLAALLIGSVRHADGTPLPFSFPATLDTSCISRLCRWPHSRRRGAAS